MKDTKHTKGRPELGFRVIRVFRGSKSGLNPRLDPDHERHEAHEKKTGAWLSCHSRVSW
ncbi:hypothetical protein RSSM_02868 [Rhodopirellula sallentina SM41]|uniref:Uncharacterized protein n=1 Tax=Rhodopirellula sallentina SM41 TaxID=1263870 RepID=M5UCY2_9BACT|nr:hypothetical protein RSSM_02868 [Rhodopirellula sallentina SM41]